MQMLKVAKAFILKYHFVKDSEENGYVLYVTSILLVFIISITTVFYSSMWLVLSHKIMTNLIHFF
jgi:hypothetical protein